MKHLNFKCQKSRKIIVKKQGNNRRKGKKKERERNSGLRRIGNILAM